MALAAGDVPRPTGPAAQKLISAAWPGMSETALGELADEQAALATAANTYGQQVMRDMSHQRELLKGAAGDAHQTLMGKLRDHAYACADHFDTKAAAAKSYQALIHGLKLRLSQIADAAERDWNNNPPAARGLVITAYAPEVASALADAWEDFHATTAPSPPPPSPVAGTPAASNPGSATKLKDPTIQAVDNKTKTEQSDKYTEDTAKPETTGTDAKNPGGNKYTENTAKPETTGTDAKNPGGDKYSENTAKPPADSVTPAGVSQVPVMPGGGASPSMPSVPSSPSMPSSSLGGAGGLGKVANPLSGSSLGSGAVGNGAVAGGSVSGGPSVPSAATSAQGLGGGSPLVNATQSFQSGLASGLGGSPGAVASPALGRAAEPVMGQPMAAQPAGAAVGGGGPGVAQPASAAPSVGGGGPGAAAVPSSGGGGGGGAAGSGMGGGGGALAPFVPPGGAQPPGAPAATAAATASPAAPAATGGAQPGGQQPAAGGAAAPMVAATSGGTTAGMLPERDPNPDLMVARRVLTGLILGTAAAPDPVVVDWAVSVLNTSMGKQVVIASSMGGGGYIPATVALPADARLAVTDRALPMGWATRFVGWPSPVDILVAHSEKVAERLAGVSISAIAATHSGQASAYRPAGLADYATVSLADVLKAGGSAPVFGGGCQHRMVSVDPDLAQRVSMVDRGGDATIELASQITAAVVRAAQEESLHTGAALVDPADIDLLSRLGGGAVIDWADHHHQVSQRENNAMFYPSIKAAPRDLDDSQTSINARAVYLHYYRMGRLVELVRCWQHTPPSVLDIAYCATTAGFGATVAQVTAAWEQHLNRPVTLP